MPRSFSQSVAGEQQCREWVCVTVLWLSVSVSHLVDPPPSVMDQHPLPSDPGVCTFNARASSRVCSIVSRAWLIPLTKLQLVVSTAMTSAICAWVVLVDRLDVNERIKRKTRNIYAVMAANGSVSTKLYITWFTAFSTNEISGSGRTRANP